MKTENREKEDAGLMESLESRTVRGRDRERETPKKLYFKIMHSLNVHMCVFNAHPEFEEHIQHVMTLADQYAFGGRDHFDPEEVMKVPQILHVKRCRQL